VSGHLIMLYFSFCSRWLNGNHNYDEICTETGISHQNLDDIIENHPHVNVIWK
jgi:hypothetical protein